jgi:DNA-binding response OmpR family regulator
MINVKGLQDFTLHFLFIWWIMKNKVLIIDDDKKLQETLKEYFEEDEFQVVSMFDGADCIRTIEDELPDLIILDIMLPTCSGLNVLTEIKKSFHLPIILLTAKGEETDRVVGLELGADDYLPKPFSTRELLARMRAVLRRDNFSNYNNFRDDSESTIKINGITLFRLKQSLYIEGEKIELTITEYKILEVLMRNKNLILTRNKLMDLALGKDYMIFDRSIDVHISKLRAKLDLHPNSLIHIKTIRGTGYMLVAES